MWKNVFIESCILSALIFGGFYLNATLLKKEISVSEEHIQNESERQAQWAHISGRGQTPSAERKTESGSSHISGKDTETPPVDPPRGSSLSGVEQSDPSSLDSSSD